jgi:DNA-binding CsgD family transcriptional regulator
MFEISSTVESMDSNAFVRYAGPERRASTGPRPDTLLKAALDEFDFGILLLDTEGRAMHLNHTARVELDAMHPLQLSMSELRARRSIDRCAMRQAVADAATRGLRRQLKLGDGREGCVVSVVPLDTHPGAPKVMLMLGKRRGRDALAMQSFASIHKLSRAEAKVLRHLCDGVPPACIAELSHVSVTTIRTQIASIRTKTDSATIRELVQKIGALPPLMSVLRKCLE